MGSDSNRKLQYAIGFCLFALTLATYSSVAHHEFVNYDDLRLIVSNPKLTRPATLPNLLSHFYEPETGNSNWLPLYWISLQLGFALHGPNPVALILTNVFIHAASAVLRLHFGHWIAMRSARSRVTDGFLTPCST